MHHHLRGLRRLLQDDALLDAVEADWRRADLSPRRKAVLAYVEKLTTAPWTVERADIHDLRGAGLSDRDVLEVAEVAGYYAYVNRIADGLGVELENDGDDPE